MQQILLFVILGLAPGALIAGLSLGVVLTYRGTGVVNLATGSIAMVAAYAYFGLRTGGYLFVTWLPLGGPWDVWPSVGGALVVAALLGVLLELFVLRPLRPQSALTKLLATLGVFLTLQALMLLSFSSDVKAPPPVLDASGTNTFDIFGIRLERDGAEIAAGVVVLAVLLALVYRFSTFGLATRAAAENETNAALAGISANRSALVNVVLGSVIAGAVGVAVSPTTGLDPFSIPLIVVPALAAAIFAKFTSFPIAVVVGLIFGMVESLIKLLQAQPWFPTVGGYPLTGVSDVIFFLAVVVAMLVRGSALPKREHLAERRLPAVVAPTHIVRPAVIAAVASVVFFLVLPYGLRQGGINTLLAMVIALSFVVIIGYLGQASLIQVALAGVAGFIVSKLGVSLHIGFPLGPVIAIAASTLLGVAVAFSALRVRGVNLAIVTLSAAVALDTFVFQNPYWGAGGSGSPVPVPQFFGLNIGNSSPVLADGSLPSPFFGILIALTTIVATMLVAKIRLVGLGHRFLAVRSNERAAAAAGISVRSTKLVGFALSSAIAGLGGVMYAYNFGAVSEGRYTLATALGVIAFAYVGGIATTRGAVISGTMVVGGISSVVIFDQLNIPDYYQLLLGGLALVSTIVLKPEGIAGGPTKRQLAGTPPLLDVVWARFSHALRRSRPAVPGSLASESTREDRAKAESL
jgi:branched-chain amino acid transport system permease protein